MMARSYAGTFLGFIGSMMCLWALVSCHSCALSVLQCLPAMPKGVSDERRTID